MGELDDDSYIKCHECGKLIAPWETYDSKYCKKCSEIIKDAKLNSLHRCVGCNNFFHPSELHNNYCTDCSKKLRKCKECGKKCIPDKFSLCPNCHDNLVKVCNICKKEYITRKKSQFLCTSCNKKKRVLNHNDKTSIKTLTSNKDIVIEKNDRTIELLIKGLHDENNRIIAEENLVKMGISAINQIIELFNSKNNKVRKSAIKILVLIGEDSIDPLAIALKNDDYSIRKNAAKTLGKIGNTRAVKYLIKSLDDTDSFVRSSSTKALGKIGDEQAVEPLIISLEDSNLNVRTASAKSLGLIGDDKAVDPLIEALDDGNPELRIASAQALGEIGDERALDSLSVYIDNHDSNVAIYC